MLGESIVCTYIRWKRCGQWTEHNKEFPLLHRSAFPPLWVTIHLETRGGKCIVQRLSRHDSCPLPSSVIFPFDFIKETRLTSLRLSFKDKRRPLICVK